MPQKFDKPLEFKKYSPCLIKCCVCDGIPTKGIRETGELWCDKCALYGKSPVYDLYFHEKEMC